MQKNDLKKEIKLLISSMLFTTVALIAENKGLGHFLVGLLIIIIFNVSHYSDNLKNI